MTELEKAANNYVAETEGDDCLCQRSQPGTPVGEHLYVGCCCKIADAFKAGYTCADKQFRDPKNWSIGTQQAEKAREP